MVSRIALCYFSITALITTKQSIRRQHKDLLWCPHYGKLFIQTHVMLFCSFGNHLLGNKFLSELFSFSLMILLARHWEENQDRWTRKRARLQCCRHEVTVLDSTFTLICSEKAHWGLLCWNYLSLFVYLHHKGCNFKIKYRCQKSHKNTNMT